jgi:drug/metabolite transporter (DMT)-like permease
VVFFAVRDLATRRIPAQVPSLFVTFVTTVAVMVTGGFILFPLGGWTPLSAKGVSLLALAAVLVLIGYQCVIIALRIGDISAIAPFRYTALLWAILLGYLVFGDVPDAMMATGATIIVLSGLYTFHRERKLARLVAASASAVPSEGV